jgi:hypothetical protein
MYILSHCKGLFGSIEGKRNDFNGGENFKNISLVHEREEEGR